MGVEVNMLVISRNDAVAVNMGRWPGQGRSGLVETSDSAAVIGGMWRYTNSDGELIAVSRRSGFWLR